ncbi:c-type cytochrome [Halopseudomonas nanhaiensis]|uniref:di-heme oxidoreductase family protein n=1 Tax=Halopseudomonas nanhaiensis TaxID=2830842 RepID=UPI001CBAE750|nr:di-heme oxidoredictase family protein [Halopseudomonas nanhaiensis]UAW99919.1 c-type cytochrome [Halopseudomonas nanhaiensis]
MNTLQWLTGLLVLAVVSPTMANPPIQQNPRSGGDGSIGLSNQNAFSLPQANLPMTKRLDFSVGNSFFRNPWVVAPASTDARDGLGPLFNTNSCQGCHVKDGRGNPPGDGAPSVSLFLRLAVPPQSDADSALLKRHGFVPEPVYGSQLQTAAIPGSRPEADLVVEWERFQEELADGTRVPMRRPLYTIANPNYGPLAENVQISPRVAPPMIGLGLLAAIPEQDLLAASDADDADGNGVSGRVNRVWDRAVEQTVVGRFGWKAGEPNVLQQSMGAFAGDMGITSSLVPATDCTPQQGCDSFAHGGEFEVSDEVASFVAFYASSLAVPMRRDMDKQEVRQGAELFNDSGCAACHTPRHVTGVIEGRPDLSAQEIWPYSDLLLHDMGAGLADGRGEFLADGNEWRTPPLWGLGLTHTINPLAGYLHDGRAETLEQAILWHDGEALAAKDAYRHLEASQRNALLRFLESL